MRRPENEYTLEPDSSPNDILVKKTSDPRPKLDEFENVVEAPSFCAHESFGFGAKHEIVEEFSISISASTTAHAETLREPK